MTDGRASGMLPVPTAPVPPMPRSASMISGQDDCGGDETPRPRMRDDRVNVGGSGQ